MDDFLATLPFINGSGLGADNGAPTFLHAFGPMIALIAGFFMVLAMADFVLNLLSRQGRFGGSSPGAAAGPSGALAPGSSRGLARMAKERRKSPGGAAVAPPGPRFDHVGDYWGGDAKYHDGTQKKLVDVSGEHASGSYWGGTEKKTVMGEYEIKRGHMGTKGDYN